MKKIKVTLACLVIIFLGLSCNNENNTVKNINMALTLNSEIGNIGDSVNFTKQVLYLEDLNFFLEKLYPIHNNSDKANLISFYEETLALLGKKAKTDYLEELKEICEAEIEDVKIHENYEFGDLFSAWDYLRLFYSSTLDINTINKNSEYVTLSEKDYSDLLIYSSWIIEEAQKDEEYDVIFAYKIIGNEHGKTKIAFYELIF